MREILNIIHANDLSSLVHVKPSSIYAIYRWNYNSIKWDEIEQRISDHIKEVVFEYKEKFRD